VFHNQRIYSLDHQFLYKLSESCFVSAMHQVRQKYIQEVRALGVSLHAYLSKLSVHEIVGMKEIPLECIPDFLVVERFIPFNIRYLKWCPDVDTFLYINYLLLTDEDVPSGCARPDMKLDDQITMLVNSDEVIRKCGEYSNFGWSTKDKPIPLSKSKGQGCMMSGFAILEGSGWLELSPIEYARWRWGLYMESYYGQVPLLDQHALLDLSRKADTALHQKVPILPQFCKEDTILWDPVRMDSTILLTYGKGKDGYFDSAKFIGQFKRALQIGAIKRPNCQIIHLIDHSGCHDAKAKDALDVHKMTVGDNCKTQPNMRSTFFGEEKTPQQIGKKGLVTVLLERKKNPFKLDTTKPKSKQELIAMLLEEPDFAASSQTNLIDEVLSLHNSHWGRNDGVLWGVKYHPELMFIEQKWAYDRDILQPDVNGRYTEWPEKMLAASRICPLLCLQRFCRKSYDTSECYSEGTHLSKLREALKKKKTHRTGSSPSQLVNLNRDT
jgi:hypothetical protein